MKQKDSKPSSDSKPKLFIEELTQKVEECLEIVNDYAYSAETLREIIRDAHLLLFPEIFRQEQNSMKDAEVAQIIKSARGRCLRIIAFGLAKNYQVLEVEFDNPYIVQKSLKKVNVAEKRLFIAINAHREMRSCNVLTLFFPADEEKFYFSLDDEFTGKDTNTICQYSDDNCKIFYVAKEKYKDLKAEEWKEDIHVENMFSETEKFSVADMIWGYHSDPNSVATFN